MCAASAARQPIKRHRNTFLQRSKIGGNDTASPLALVILNTRDDVDSDSLLRRLWNRARVKVCADGGANRLYDRCETTRERETYVPDAIVGDLDSIRDEVRTYYEQRGAQVVHRPDQDHNDFEKCLVEVENRLGAEATVLALGAFGGRFDHEMAAINVLHMYTARFARLVIMGAGNVAFVLSPRCSHVITLDDRFEGPTVGLIPVGSPCRVTTSGLRWNLDDRCLQFGELVSSSNEVVGEVRVCTNSPLVWTAEFNVTGWIGTIDG